VIRFGRLFDTATDADRRRLTEAQALFRKVFPREQEYAERLAWLVKNRAALDHDVVVLTAEDERGRMIGLALVYYFPRVRYGFLDYIGSGPERRGRGVGQALYEAVREYLLHKGADGLFMEVPPDEPDHVVDPKVLPERRARLKFYERFGACPILGTRWDDPPVRPDYDPPFLVYDDLGRGRPLPRDRARHAARRILQARYGKRGDEPDVRMIVQSFRDDPVRLRTPRYAAAEAPVAASHGQIRPIKVVVPAQHEIHHVRSAGYVERPARVGAILKALQNLPHEIRPVAHVGEGPIRAVHDADFVSYLRRATENLGPTETIYPQVFPIRRPERKPREMPIRAGYYCIDTFTPLGRDAYKAARAAVDCVVSAARLLQAGEHIVYAVCRPPGHHAERRVYGGFCYFNNAAIAAEQLSRSGTVAILDVDYHHGNGQQDIFYSRGDVLTVSLHGHPRDHYPYFAGYADERGTGDGRGANRNYTLGNLLGDEGYLETLQHALSDIRAFKPAWLVVSLGYDTMRGDPTGNFALSANGIRRTGEGIGQLNLPTLVVQEGGYTLRNLAVGARAFFTGLSRAWYA
jgi:acetoin utilization deacetylase AcuC-like enzyme/GNAT superfamily N-acetyltransferase